jgi:hypothetical protein
MPLPITCPKNAGSIASEKLTTGDGGCCNVQDDKPKSYIEI